MPFDRHVGFKDVVWATITIDKAISLSWNISPLGILTLVDDDVPVRQGVIPYGVAGQITLTGRKAFLVPPTRFGWTSNITANMVGADPDGILSEAITFYDATLVGLGQAFTTNGIAMRTLTFEYSRFAGTKDLYAV